MCKEIELFMAEVEFESASLVLDVSAGGYEQDNVETLSCGDNFYL